MKFLSTFIRGIKQSKTWRSELEDIVGNQSSELIELNQRKKSLGVSGLGTVLFGELFDVNPDPKVAYVTSAFNLFTSYIDCHIDNTHGLDLDSSNQGDISSLLDEAANYLETGETDNDFLLKTKPLVDYVRSSIINRDETALQSFCAHARGYAESVKRDLILEDPNERREERIKLGKAYGNVVSDLLNIFSERRLNEDQRKAIQIFSACGTLQDDFVDITEDGSWSYILAQGVSLMSNISNLYQHRKGIIELYKLGSELIENPSERSGYKRMFNSLMIGGDLFFVKKGISYLTEKVHDLEKRQIVTPEQKLLG